MSRTAMLVSLVAGGLAAGVGALTWRFAFFLAPFAWTGEPARLAAALQIGPGSHVADLGAGDGALALAIADVVGAGGRVYATELSAERRETITARVAAAHGDGRPGVEVIAAGELTTGLVDDCCDAVYMRAMFHHVTDRAAFAAAVSRAVRPGGRIAVIDFAPGTLWFHGSEHGVTADAVATAFRQAGWRPVARDDAWGGGMFLLVFGR
jgi:ubiquinone/menaquinone biosynthesis C-methylase UbiE